MILQLKITLQGSSAPVIWRRLHIDSEADFEALHFAIQYSFGWKSAHLWEFAAKPFTAPRIAPILGEDDLYGLALEEEEGVLGAPETLLSQFLNTPKQKFCYLYDMGDNWEHEILVEKILAGTLENALCLAGEGACPPEDCGGIWGYYRTVEILKDPKHEEYEDLCEWLEVEKGKTWDVHAFDLAAAQAAMRGEKIE